MKKKWLYLILLLVLTFCSYPSIFSAVRGQENQTEVMGEINRICLKGTGTTDIQNTVHGTPTAKTNVYLEGSGFGNNSPIYVALCLPSKKKSVCSTGNPITDKEIFQQDYTEDLKNLDADAGAWGGFVYGERNTGKLSIEIVENKLKPDLAGNIKATVIMTNSQGHFVYPFYGFFRPPGTAVTGGVGGEQQGKLDFLAPNINCTSILWDPYGRIFDSQSLEPIPNITVKVLTDITPSEKLAQIFGNPQTSFADGAFNFLVEPGTYYLRLVNPPTKYSFIPKPNLNINYSKAYSKRDGTNSVYKPDDPIVEVAGKPEHRDIPLDPGKNPPSHFPLVNITSYGYDQISLGDSTQYGGKISHPLSIVALVGQKTQKEVSRITADKFGYWNVLIENKLIPQDEPLLIKLIKVDLTTMIPDEKDGKITNDIVFYPIARKINGYLYDNGKPAAGAVVTITLENNSKPFYQITANNNGYIAIPSNKLPNFSYDLMVKFVGTNIAKKISTDVFAQENKTYLEKNNINLMVSDIINNKPTSTQKRNSNERSENSNESLGSSQKPTILSPADQPPVSSVDNQKKILSAIIIFIIALASIALIIIVFFALKKNRSFPDETTHLKK